MGWLQHVAVHALTANAQFGKNTGSLFAPEFEQPDLAWLADCGPEVVGYERRLCEEKFVNLRDEQCGDWYSIGEDMPEGSDFWDIDLYTPWFYFSKTLMLGGPSIMNAILFGEADDAVTNIFTSPMFWLNWIWFIVSAVICVFFWLSMFINLYWFCCCSCARTCWGKMCCKKCCHDRNRKHPFWSLSKCKVCYTECYNWWFHLMIGLGLIPMCFYLCAIFRPETWGRFTCKVMTASYSMLYGLPGAAGTNFERMAQDIAGLGQIYQGHSAQFPMTKGSGAYSATCTVPMLFLAEGSCDTADSCVAQFASGATGMDNFFIDGDSKTWIKNPKGAAAQHPLYTTPGGFIDPSNTPDENIFEAPYPDVIGNTTPAASARGWGCAWQNPALGIAFAPYYKKFGWGRIARTIGHYYEMIDTGDTAVVGSYTKEMTPFTSQYSYRGNTYGCHKNMHVWNGDPGVTNVAVGTPGCSVILAFNSDPKKMPGDVDAYIPSYVGASLGGFYAEDATGWESNVTYNDRVKIANEEFDYRPDNYFARNTDIYSAGDGKYVPDARTNVQNRPTQDLLTHIITKGVVETPSIPTLASLQAYGGEEQMQNITAEMTSLSADIQARLTGAEDVSDLYDHEVPTLLLRAHSLVEGGIATASIGSKVPFLATVAEGMSPWIGSNGQVCLNGAVLEYCSDNSHGSKLSPRYAKYIVGLKDAGIPAADVTDTNVDDAFKVPAVLNSGLKNTYMMVDPYQKAYSSSVIQDTATNTTLNLFLGDKVLGADDTFATANTLGRHLITRKAQYGRGMVPSLKDWVDYFRAYGPSTDTGAMIPNPTIMQDMFEVPQRTAPTNLAEMENFINFDIDFSASFMGAFMNQVWFGWMVTETTGEQMPFTYFHKPNVALDLVVDLITATMDHADIGGALTGFYSDVRLDQFTQINDAFGYMSNILSYSFGDAPDADSMQKAYLTHYWVYFTVVCLCIFLACLWLGSFILFMTLACRKCCKKDPSRKSAGHIYRGMCCCMCTEMWAWMIIMLLGCFLVPLSGELAHMCDPDNIVNMLNTDASVWFPSETNRIIREQAVRNCVATGEPFKVEHFGTDLAIVPAEVGDQMANLQTEMNYFFGTIEEYHDPKFHDYGNWSIPIVGPGQVYPGNFWQKNATGSWSTRRDDNNGYNNGMIPVPYDLTNMFTYLSDDLDRAKDAVENDFDAVQIAIPHGLVITNNTEYQDAAANFPHDFLGQNITNYGMSPYEPALSMVSDKLNFTHVRSDHVPLGSSLDLVRYAAEITFWNQAAADEMSKTPIWFGGQVATPYATAKFAAAACGATFSQLGGVGVSGDDLYCRTRTAAPTADTAVLQDNSTKIANISDLFEQVEKSQMRYNYQNMDLSAVTVPSADHPKTVRLAVDPVVATPPAGIPAWGAAIHEWLEELVGGDIATPPADRSWCEDNKTAYFDICVLGRRVGDVESYYPVAGRCSLEANAPFFNPDEDCLSFGNDFDTPEFYDTPFAEDSQDRYICIKPLRTSKVVEGDLYATDDISFTASTNPGNPYEPDGSYGALGDLLSGLVPVMQQQGGRVAKFLDPTCALFCDKATLIGQNPITTVNDETAMDGRFFGTPSFMGQTQPMLSSHIPHYMPKIYQKAGKSGVTSPMRYLASYRDCIVPSIPDEAYPIKGNVAPDATFWSTTTIPTELSDEQKAFVQFLADIQYVQNLTTTANDWQIEFKTSLQRSAFKDAMAADLAMIPVAADVALEAEEIYQEVLYNLNDLTDFAVIINQVVDCGELSGALHDVTDGICREPIGMLAGFAWLAFFLGWTFLIFFCFSFKQMHYWINRNKKDGHDRSSSDDLDDILVHSYYGKEKDVEAILRKHPGSYNDVDYMGNNALHMACFKNQYNAAKIILVHHDARHKRSSSSSSSSSSKSGNRRSIKDRRNHAKYTPLHVACYEGHTDLVKLLHEFGCDMNKRDEFGDTCLTAMARTGNIDMVETLIECHANVAKPTRSLNCAHAIAKRRGDNQMMEKLDHHRRFSSYENNIKRGTSSTSMGSRLSSWTFSDRSSVSTSDLVRSSSSRSHSHHKKSSSSSSSSKRSRSISKSSHKSSHKGTSSSSSSSSSSAGTSSSDVTSSSS